MHSSILLWFWENSLLDKHELRPWNRCVLHKNVDSRKVVDGVWRGGGERSLHERVMTSLWTVTIARRYQNAEVLEVVFCVDFVYAAAAASGSDTS